MPLTPRFAVNIAVAFALAACASSTPPPTGGDPTPVAGVRITSLEGTADGYAGGPANIAMFEYDSSESVWHLGGSVGSIDADGDFALELTDALSTSVLFTTNADEVAELYGECLTMSRSWRTGGRGIDVYTGDDIQARTPVAAIEMFDEDDPAAFIDLMYMRPVPGDATVTLTIRLPIEVTVVTEAGASEPNSTTAECGDDVRVIELVQGWYWTVTRGGFYDTTLPNGDEVQHQVITRFDVGGETPEGLRFVAN